MIWPLSAGTDNIFENLLSRSSRGILKGGVFYNIETYFIKSSQSSTQQMVTGFLLIYNTTSLDEEETKL
jgi:hypothetical protein